jgi:hypothetical protein
MSLNLCATEYSVAVATVCVMSLNLCYVAVAAVCVMSLVFCDVAVATVGVMSLNLCDVAVVAVTRRLARQCCPCTSLEQLRGCHAPVHVRQSWCTIL